jgi:hypothetical protein
MKLALFVIIPLGVAMAACASTPIPADRVARSTAAVRNAEMMNADHIPTASVYLRLAHEELAEGRRLIRAGDNDQAIYVLLRSEADADAAMNLAREAVVRQDAMQTIQAVRIVKAQLEGPQP